MMQLRAQVRDRCQERGVAGVEKPQFVDIGVDLYVFTPQPKASRIRRR
jgi:hypothetical protein